MESATNTLLDQVKARYALPSDYALAALLGITRSMVSAYRKKKRLLGDEPAIKVAELLDLDPGLVLAAIAAERAQSETARAAWLSLASRLKTLGGVAVLLILAPSPAPSAVAAPLAALASISSAARCILCQIRRGLSWRPMLHHAAIAA